VAKRILNIIGDIDLENFKEFSVLLDALENKGSETDIHIRLSSPGGDVYSALAFASRIRLSQCNIIITAYGTVASAAVLVLAAGDYRIMAKESWVMVHEESGEGSFASVEVLERETKHARRMEDQWDDLLAQWTRTDRTIWANLHKKTTYLTAQDCLQLGLIEKII
jgi:ATP-dependent Clp protease, protease subunit